MLVFPLLLLILALSDGIGEELGWRGVALPGLQRWLGPTVASVLLGGAWAVWHLPLLWTSRVPLEGRPFPLLLLALIPTSILFTWVYRHIGGSILAAVLLHGTHNLAGPALPRTEEGLFTPFLMAVLLKWALALAVLVADPAFRTGGDRAMEPREAANAT